jgi:hypothetical protein
MKYIKKKQRHPSKHALHSTKHSSSGTRTCIVIHLLSYLRKHAAGDGSVHLVRLDHAVNSQQSLLRGAGEDLLIELLGQGDLVVLFLAHARLGPGLLLSLGLGRRGSGQRLLGLGFLDLRE